MLKVHHTSFQSSNGSFEDGQGVKTKMLSYIALMMVLAHSVRGTNSWDLRSTSWTLPLAGPKFYFWPHFFTTNRREIDLFQVKKMSKYVLKIIAHLVAEE